VLLLLLLVMSQLLHCVRRCVGLCLHPRSKFAAAAAVAQVAAADGS
jgi:hypothetical protein